MKNCNFDEELLENLKEERKEISWRIREKKKEKKEKKSKRTRTIGEREKKEDYPSM